MKTISFKRIVKYQIAKDVFSLNEENVEYQEGEDCITSIEIQNNGVARITMKDFYNNIKFIYVSNYVLEETLTK